jgi:hypothetical protein
MDEQELVARVVEAVDTDQSVATSSNQIPELKTLIDQWMQEHPDTPLPQEVLWEVWMLDLVGKRRGERQGNVDIRFTDRATFKDGTVYPNVNQLATDNNATQYFRQRADTTTNPVRKARYADFVWSFRNQQRGANLFPFAQVAVSAYLHQIDLCFAQNKIKTLADNLDRVAELASELNNADTARLVVAQVENATVRLFAAQKYKAISYLGDTLIYLHRRFPGFIPQALWQKFLAICEDVIALFATDESRNVMLANEFGNLASSVCSKLGESGRAWQYQVQNAGRIEQEAYRLKNQEQQPAGLLSAFQTMKEAVRAYQLLLSLAPDAVQQQAIRQRLNRIQLDLRRLIRDIQPQLTAFPTKVELPEELQEIVNALIQEEPDHFIDALLALVIELVPSVEKVKELARQVEVNTPLLTILPRITLRDARQVDEIAPVNEETAHFVHCYHDNLQRYAIVIDYVIQRLTEAGKLSLDLLTKYIAEWVYIDADDVPFIERGLERYFAADYISAISVLVPRFEHMLKTALETLNIAPIAIPNERQIRELTFGDFLSRQDVRERLGEDVWHFLYHTLVDENGLNLRNDVAHGWLQLHHANRITANLVIFIVLLLTASGRGIPSFS